MSLLLFTANVCQIIFSYPSLLYFEACIFNVYGVFCSGNPQASPKMRCTRLASPRLLENLIALPPRFLICVPLCKLCILLRQCARARIHPGAAKQRFSEKPDLSGGVCSASFVMHSPFRSKKMPKTLKMQV